MRSMVKFSTYNDTMWTGQQKVKVQFSVLASLHPLDKGLFVDGVCGWEKPIQLKKLNAHTYASEGFYKLDIGAKYKYCVMDANSRLVYENGTNRTIDDYTIKNLPAKPEFDSRPCDFLAPSVDLALVAEQLDQKQLLVPIVQKMIQDEIEAERLRPTYALFGCSQEELDKLRSEMERRFTELEAQRLGLEDVTTRVKTKVAELAGEVNGMLKDIQGLRHLVREGKPAGQEASAASAVLNGDLEATTCSPQQWLGLHCGNASTGREASRHKVEHCLPQQSDSGWVEAEARLEAKDQHLSRELKKEFMSQIKELECALTRQLQVLEKRQRTLQEHFKDLPLRVETTKQQNQGLVQMQMSQTKVEKELQEQKAELDALSCSVRERVDEWILNAVSSRVEDLERRQTIALECRLKDLTREIETSHSENQRIEDAARRQTAALQERLKDVADEMREHQSDAESKIQALQDMNTKTEDQLSSVLRRSEDLTRQIETSRSETQQRIEDAARRQIAALQERLKDVRSEVEELLQAQRAALEKEMRKRAGEVTELSKDIQGIRGKLAANAQSKEAPVPAVATAGPAAGHSKDERAGKASPAVGAVGKPEEEDKSAGKSAKGSGAVPAAQGAASKMMRKETACLERPPAHDVRADVEKIGGVHADTPQAAAGPGPNGIKNVWIGDGDPPSHFEATRRHSEYLEGEQVAAMNPQQAAPVEPQCSSGREHAAAAFPSPPPEGLGTATQPTFPSETQPSADAAGLGTRPTGPSRASATAAAASGTAERRTRSATQPAFRDERRHEPRYSDCAWPEDDRQSEDKIKQFEKRLFEVATKRDHNAMRKELRQIQKEAHPDRGIGTHATFVWLQSWQANCKSSRPDFYCGEWKNYFAANP